MRPRAIFSALLVLVCGWATGSDAAAAEQKKSAASHAPAEANAADAAVETGTLAGAAYRIDVPANWNRGLVVYFHGYEITPLRLSPQEPPAPQLQQLLQRGYAVAQSAYSATGWAVEQAAADSEALRRHFNDKHGTSRETFVVGMSMGGTLTAMALETAADTYAGGLSLCGAIEASDSLLQRDFALVAAFNYYFPDLLGPWTPVPADYLPTAAVEAKIAAALRGNSGAAQSLLGIWGVGNLQTLTDILAFDY